ncbi:MULTISPECIES: hypothetical protein [Thiorhodovibrio]|jgi:hypothetical protein|uniref:hypothetical protein n=1 Tax=Thiorhodovibrio TaxID=61593 RepID=UPI0019138826|nr:MULTISPECIES: hypothetical protein [Thiorhodovibrio]MBK5968490.1 hypothetical protein [Thiorhodovibrio winogradskyi]WPL11135.1 hypothetical protein Thiosp_00863 [Thiorhodovibrio litoralis]
MTTDDRTATEDAANRFMDLHEDLMFVFKHNMVRSTTRINNIIRYAMLGMVVMMIAMLALIATFTSRMDKITFYMVEMADDMQRMRSDFDRVNRDMLTMEQAVVEMDTQVSTMPSIYQSVAGMGNNMGSMREDILTIAERMDFIEQHMTSIGATLYTMDRQLIDMTGNVGGIGRDVDIMSRPMSIFPNN